MNREYKALDALRRGEDVVVYGARVRESDGNLLILDRVTTRMIPGDIVPGDWYVGERNTGPVLGKCRRIEREKGAPWVEATEVGVYSYDLHECVRVEVTAEVVNPEATAADKFMVKDEAQRGH